MGKVKKKGKFTRIFLLFMLDWININPFNSVIKYCSVGFVCILIIKINDKISVAVGEWPNEC